MLLGAALGLAAPMAFGVTIGQIDTFSGGGPTGFAGGGPNGKSRRRARRCLRTAVQVGTVTRFCRSSRIPAAGVGSMDLINLDQTDLTIRLYLEDSIFGPSANEAVTTFGFNLPVGNG